MDMMSFMVSNWDDEEEQENMFNYDILEQVKKLFDIKTTDPRLLFETYNCFLKLHSSHTIVLYKKKIIKESKLDLRGRALLKKIKNMDESHVMNIYNLMNNNSETSKKRSGRTLDTLVTIYTKLRDASYYLNIKTKEVFLEYQDGCELINIANKYKHNMFTYSKEYFDCFARGDDTEIKLSTGSIFISLGKFNFFYWADKLQLLKYLELKYDDIVSVRQQNQNKNKNKQKNTKKRKFKNQFIKIKKKKKKKTQTYVTFYKKQI
jgi:hypothetical protein